MHQDLLKNKLSSLLQSGMIQGKSPRVLARELKNAFNTSTYDAERLMRTELARVQTEAQKQSFKRNGFTLYEFIANSGCCDICKSKDGKHFKVENVMPGENAAPMHPHCRCSAAPWEDSDEYEAWLDYLDKGGATEQWNAKDKAIWKSQRRHDKEVEKSENSGTTNTGAILGALNSKNDADGQKRDAHAERYYRSMRKRSKADVVSSIAKNTGIDTETVSKIFDHLFINKYDLEKGCTYFDADYNISESVRRLQEGKNILEHDKILIKHEAMEYDLMNNDGMSYDDAHALTNKYHNYQEALEKWLDENDAW